MSKKNKNVVIVVVIVTVLMLIMVFANFKNVLVRQLQGPTEGTDSILTVEGRLSVVSKDNHIFTWQWNGLKIWPIVAKQSAIAITPFANDKIIYNPSNNPAKLILTNLKADTELGSLSLPYGAECKTIKTSQNGKFGVASVIFKEGTQKRLLKLGIFDENSKEPSFVFQKDINAENFALYDFTITGDGNLLAGAGEKNQAWVFVTDIKNGNVLWEKTFGEYGQFTSIGFSPDGKTLFVSEKVRHILVFDIATGQLVNKFVMDEYPTPAHQKQNISCIAISPDGKTLAADTEPAGTVWFWDIVSGSKIGEIYASELTVSDIAFSPDSKFLATGCLVSSEIKIWKVPQPKP